jgi:hypothetical protein
MCVRERERNTVTRLMAEVTWDEPLMVARTSLRRRIHACHMRRRRTHVK